MSIKTYFVSAGRSCCLPGGVLLKPGQAVPQGLKPAVIKEWIDSGFIHGKGDTPVAQPEGMPAIKAEGALSEPAKKAEFAPVVPAPAAVQKGKFTEDPVALEGKDLEELNLMLANLDEEAADTVEEAVALLSADFAG